jgi:hypothetical protein
MRVGPLQPMHDDLSHQPQSYHWLPGYVALLLSEPKQSSQGLDDPSVCAGAALSNQLHDAAQRMVMSVSQVG